MSAVPESALRICRLADAPHSVDEVERLITETWPDWYGGAEQGGGRGVARDDLALRMARTGVPLGFVALLDGRAIGTVALGLNGHGAEPAEGPWINGLCVAPDRRGAGIGAALVAAAEAELCRQGYPRAYATAREARTLFLRRGWRCLRVLEDGWHVLARDYDRPDGPALTVVPGGA
ncbi:GNAT family N-acetyltransferase [Wenxinia saemankumensis]|uniref:Acetyltransferase (GNAT) family protein n=1 Tax=Wenxinia saemankumensis TaxID=1447782 RepID=A0A1M6E5X9_9RHOB|nr:GNAT family N-acetyltransferase [Wenxinia saemankumensis]SHI80803.1 Acetyltransferase (GNAT) family protein [Wenxinia saemankumensis]